MARQQNHRTCRILIVWPGWLIIEVDGDPHGDSIQIRKAMTRDKYLEALGFTVLRFENRFVVLNEIRKVFRKKIKF